ncbi:MAG: hypothetical protein HY959_11530 [Ignavibacteriae bacterium]|nr:hypothetical protein [Ignavibacteriota bacterium]
MKTYIFILLLPFLLCCSGLAVSQVEQEEELIITKPETDSVDIDTFYDELSKDGEWIKVDRSDIDNEEVLEMSETVEIDEDVITEYIWRPSVSITLVDWNPYTYGHWEFCRFGWIWVSDYNWGWGPYHYGRWWFSHRWGWVWSPGHRWAPSWVSWCHTRHHVGWHPISPRTHWRHHNGIIVTHPKTPKQKGITNKWTFVSKKDFTRPITKNSTIDLKKNKDILKDAKMVVKSDEVYNLGPKKSDIEKNAGEKISTRKVSVTSLNGKPIDDNTTKKFEKKVKTTQINNTKNEKNYSTEKNPNNTSVKRQDNTKKKSETTKESNTYKSPNTKKDNGSYKSPNTKKDNGSYKSPNTKKDNGSYKSPNTKKDNGSNKNSNKNSNSNSNSNKSGNTKKSSSNDYNWNSGNTKSKDTYKSNDSYKSSNTYKSNDSYKSNNSNSSNSYKSSNSHSSNNNSSYKSGNSNSSNHNSSSNTNKSSNNSGNNNSGNKKK